MIAHCTGPHDALQLLTLAGSGALAGLWIARQWLKSCLRAVCKRCGALLRRP